MNSLYHFNILLYYIKMNQRLLVILVIFILLLALISFLIHQQYRQIKKQETFVNTREMFHVGGVGCNPLYQQYDMTLQKSGAYYLLYSLL